jgi:proline iminopeptidase
MLPVSGGDSLFYRIVGRGTDTIVVLHGGPALNGRYLEEAFRPLAESHILLFYDQRGRGRSSAAHQPDSLSFDQDLADLEAVQSHFALGPLRLIGHHWGAALAAQYAIRHPGQVARMVLVSPLVHQSSEVYQLSVLPNDSAAFANLAVARQAHADSLDPARFCREFWGFAFSPVEITAPSTVRQLAPAVCSDAPDRLRQREEISRRLYISLGRWKWTDSLALASPPALLIVGNDTQPLLDDWRLWTGHLHDARLLLAGHTALLPWIEAGAEVNRDLEVFLRGDWPVKALRVDSSGLPITGS